MAKEVDIIATIGDETSNRTCRLDQIVGNADVADIARGEPNDRWTPQNIRQDMDLCGLTATRKTDGLALRPPLPPWAERCGVTSVWSIDAVASIQPASTRACRMRCQMRRR